MVKSESNDSGKKKKKAEGLKPEVKEGVGETKEKKVQEKDVEEKELSLEKKVELAEEDEEEGVQAPMEMAEGITDTLDHIDIRETLRHSGEADQKTRAHLEEELADIPWSPKEEGGVEVNYGEIKKDSGEGEKNHYTNDKELSKEAYSGINPYEHSENFYDVLDDRGDENKVGEIRGKRHSELEIPGLSERAKIKGSDFMEKHDKDDYE